MVRESGGGLNQSITIKTLKGMDPKIIKMNFCINIFSNIWK